jgi:DNA polymerase I
LSRHPGQDVAYVVVDDSRRSPARVQLAHETLTDYDSDFYATLALRAGESILAPLGWDRDRIRKHLRKTTTQTLGSYQ